MSNFLGSLHCPPVHLQIQGMKATQITAKVNQLVVEKKISDMSQHRDLWTVLHDCGLYDKSESNWNQQVK